MNSNCFQKDGDMGACLAKNLAANLVYRQQGNKQEEG